MLNLFFTQKQKEQKERKRKKLEELKAKSEAQRLNEVMAINTAAKNKIKDDEEYRLIGVGISELVDENLCDLDNLIDTNENNEKKLDQAINSLRDKFGRNIINHGKNYE